MGQGGDAEDLTRLIAEVARWTAQARAEEAAASRSREGWLRHQASEDTSWAGLVLDLVERAEPVVVETVGGRAHRGRLAAVGADFVAMIPAGERSGAIARLLSSDALSVLRPHHSTRTGSGPREPAQSAHPGRGQGLVASRVKMADVLAVLAADRTRVMLTDRAGAPVSGQLRWVGRDVAGLRLDGDPPSDVQVRLTGVSEVAILASS